MFTHGIRSTRRTVSPLRRLRSVAVFWLAFAAIAALCTGCASSTKKGGSGGSSGWASFFGEEEPKKPKTVNEFLRGERPTMSSAR